MAVSGIFVLVGIFVILLVGVITVVLVVCLKKVNSQGGPDQMTDQQARQDFQNQQRVTEEQNRIVQEQVQQQINQDHMRNM